MVYPRAMLHNEQLYGPEPEEFRPERFLKPGVKFPIAAFGFGRRCDLLVLHAEDV